MDMKLAKGNKVKIIGQPFNDGADIEYTGQVGTIKHVIKSGWMENCVVVKFDDEAFSDEAFDSSDVVVEG